MSKLKQTKIPVTMNENGELQPDEQLLDLLTQGKPNWKLVRERDGLTRHSVDIMWLEWNEDGTFKAKHDKPGIDRSLLMSPFNAFFTWQTTDIQEILEEREDYIKFKTKNSVYELFKLENKFED
jgi:hypothetical protein